MSPTAIGKLWLLLILTTPLTVTKPFRLSSQGFNYKLSEFEEMVIKNRHRIIMRAISNKDQKFGYGCDDNCKKIQKILSVMQKEDSKSNTSWCNKDCEDMRHTTLKKPITQDSVKQNLSTQISENQTAAENETNTEIKSQNSTNCEEKCNKNKKQISVFNKQPCDIQCNNKIEISTGIKNSLKTNNTSGLGGHENRKPALEDSIAKYITFDREYANRRYTRNYWNRFF